MSNGWLPIESAPKDGQFILFGSATMPTWLGYWRNKDSLDGRRFGEGWTRFNSDDTRIYPTHWMPLPAPPKAMP